MGYTEIIRKGSLNAVAVKAIKVRLNSVIGSTLDVTNPNFGDSTVLVVKQFQKKNQLIQDGVVGELTWERLFTIATELPIASNIIRLRAVEIMDTQLFVREKTNKNDGVEVESYLKSVGLGKGYAWCMAFLYWGFLKAATELKLKNPVPQTAGVLDCYAKAKKLGYLVTEPKEGDQFFMDFGQGKGHTGIISQVNGNTLYTIEGNTSADPSYAGEDREGNGVFERSRSKLAMLGFARYPN